MLYNETNRRFTRFGELPGCSVYFPYRLPVGPLRGCLLGCCDVERRINGWILLVDGMLVEGYNPNEVAPVPQLPWATLFAFSPTRLA